MFKRGQHVWVLKDDGTYTPGTIGQDSAGGDVYVHFYGEGEDDYIACRDVFTEDPTAKAQPRPQSTRPACHYCGLDATGRGFFDEYVCPECGGPEKNTLQ